MRYLITLSCAVALASTTLGQVPRRTDRPQYVVAPPENILLSVASQPDCPLKIEAAKLLIAVEQKSPTLYQYRLINRGNKPIHYFTVVAWHSNGAGGTLSGPAPWDGRITKRVLQRGESVGSGSDEVEIVPLTNELRDKLNVRGPLRSLVVLLVDHVTFADGSTYDAEQASRSLREYFENLAR
jgi:hypothetical protein